MAKRKSSNPFLSRWQIVTMTEWARITSMRIWTREKPDSQLVAVLDDLPRRIYTPELYQEKCDLVYRHVFDAYQGAGKSVYESA